MEFVGSKPYVVTLRAPSLCQPLAVFGVLSKGPMDSPDKEKRDTEMESQAAHSGSFGTQSGTQRFLGFSGFACLLSRDNAGDNLHGGSDSPAETDRDGSDWTWSLVQNNAGDGHHRRQCSKESTGRA
jgi:hypothetical protein